MNKVRTYDIIYQELYDLYNRYIDNSDYVYKSCESGTGDGKRYWIIILKLLDDTKSNIDREDIKDKQKASYRANKLEVILIFNKFNPTETCDKITNSYYPLKQIEYIVGEIVEEKNYDENINKIYTEGLYFYKSIMNAYFYKMHYKNIVKEYNFDGIFNTYYENGQLLNEYNFVNGTKTGLYTKYYDNGSIQFKLHYKDNILDGEYISYYFNNQIENIMNYIDGKFDGEHIKYFDDGNIEKIKNYKNGKKHGIHIEYKQDRTIKLEKYYEHGSEK